MHEVWSKIRRRALTCIDEVYPQSDNDNAAFFPVDEFLLEAGRWIVRIVPLRALGPGKELPAEDCIARMDGSGELPLPSDFIRLVSFRMKGWLRPVTVPISDADARYGQQFNRTLRGGEARPVVALCGGGSRLEYFSSAAGPFACVDDARYFGLSSLDDEFPEALAEITAWKTAELVLASMNDVGAMQLCAARVNEHLQVL